MEATARDASLRSVGELEPADARFGPRHLDSITSMAMGKSTIPELQECLTSNFDHFFGPLRKRKKDRVPSDKLREEIMVRQILNRVQDCRDDPDLMARLRTELARDVAIVRAAEPASNQF